MTPVERAHQLGAKIEQAMFGDGRWTWRFGFRSSSDQYARTFETAHDAAVHFLRSREAEGARKAEEYRRHA